MTRRVEQLIVGYEQCSPEDAELRCDNVLDCVIASDPAVTDCIFVKAMAKYSNCKWEINEKALLEIAPE